MNTDLNGKIQGKLNQNRKNRNMKKALLVLSLAAVIFTSTVLANPASALTEDVSGGVVQGLENGGDSGSGAQAPAQAADEQANAQGNEAAPSSDPQETVAAPSADQGVMNANSVSAVDSAAVTESGTGDSGIAVSGAEADGTEKSADQISAAEGSGTAENAVSDTSGSETAEQGATLAEAAETVSTEEAAADKTAEKTDVLSFADDRAQVKIARKDGTGFPSDTTMSGSPLGTDDWNRVLSAVSSKVKAQSDDSTAYSVAGLHTWTLSLQAGDGSAASYDDIRAEAEFHGGLNDAGYATKTSEKEENGTDGTSITTASYETSWRVYAISGDSIADPVEDHLTDLTDADGTSLSVDESGALQSAAFDGSLPETVVFAQIVRETVTTGTEKKKEIPMPAVTFDKEAATDHGTIMVHVEADEGTFEQGTTMSVKRVSSQDILDKAIEVAGGRGSAAAVDISFRKADGTETEPAKPIRVKMTAKVLGQADKAHVVHVDDTGSTDVVAKKSDGKTIESTSNEAASSDAKNVVSFESKSFSVYAIVYTVDFSFSGYTYSIKGGSSIRLSSLAKKLGLHDTKQNKDFAIDDVDDVTFSNSSLVEVTKKDGDWELVSKKPFTSTEKLTISMKDGSKYEVEVKDEQYTDLSKFLASAVLLVDGKEQTEWKVKPGQNYGIRLQFEEKDGLQFINDQTLEYALPQGVNVENQDGTFDIKVGKKIIQGNRFHVDKGNGKVTVNFNTQDPNFTELTQSENLEFHVDFSAQFDENVKTIKFRDTVTQDVTIDTSHHVTVQKIGNFDWNDKKMHYTVTVKSDGRSENVVVTDTLTGTAVTLDQDSIKCTSDKTSNKTFTKDKDEITDKGFKLTIPEMENNETVTFTYTASIDFSKVGTGSPITADKTSNGVNVSSKGDPNPGKAEYKEDIYYAPSTLSKEQTSISDIKTNGDQKYRDIEWKINASSNNNVKFTYIQDSIKPFDDGKYYMEYSGDGLSIVVTKEDGTKENRTVRWSDASITKTVTDEKFVGWQYNPPEKDGKASYLIKYSTKAKVQENKTVTYKNEVKDDYNQQSAEVQIRPSDDTIAITKKATEVNEKFITWKISVSVPEKGYDRLYVKDTLPNKWINKTHYFDEINSITVDGLVEGESFKRTDDTGVVNLEFYQDSAQTKQGLRPTVSNRTLNITVVTNNKQEWISNSSEPDHHNHTNTVEAGNGVISSNASDTAIVYSKSISKNGEEKTENGTHLIRYTVTITGLNSDSFVIDDTFDKSILSYEDQGVSLGDANMLYGGNQYYQGDDPTPVIIKSTDTGIRITGKNVPKQKSGAYYSHYKIVYYLKVNDTSLNQKAFDSENHKTVIANKASWGEFSADSTIDYTYHPLEKTQGQYNEDKNHPNTIPYTITVNKGKVRMNGGNAMTLTDTPTNLYIDPKDVTIITDPAAKKADVKYDIADDNKLAFTIPDETAVTITYYGYLLGETGKQINVSNTATLLGETVSTEMTTTKKASGGGTGSVRKVYIRKYETGDYNHQLAGAEFKLLDLNEKPIQYGDRSSKKGQDVIFKTDSNGSAEVYLSNENDGVSLQYDTQYYLQEIKAPEGYECSDQLIPFQISETENEPQNHIYYGSSCINISNPKIVKVKITLHKQKKGDSNTNLRGAVFSLYQAAADGSFNKSDDPLASGLTTGSDGTVVLQDKKGNQELESGIYYLVETKAPSGYEVIPSPVRLKISNGKVTVGDTEYSYSTDSSGTNTCTINIEDTPKKQFVFYKRWEESDQASKWPDNVNAIQVTLHGTFNSSDNANGKTKDYQITLKPTGSQKAASEGEVSWEAEQSNGAYKYTVANLPAIIYTDDQGQSHVGTWTYYVTETKVEGYNTFYGQNVADTEDGTVQVRIDNMKTSAGDGEYIVNKPIDRYALPSTGGPGDLPWVAPGILLLLLAGTVFAVRKLLIQRNAEKGGGSE